MSDSSEWWDTYSNIESFGEPITADDSEIDLDEHRANARLIAAAPELLEDDTPQPTKSQRMAKAAKAKAKPEPEPDDEPLITQLSHAIETAPSTDVLQKITADLNAWRSDDTLTPEDSATLHGLIEARELELTAN